MKRVQILYFKNLARAKLLDRLYAMKNTITKIKILIFILTWAYVRWNLTLT